MRVDHTKTQPVQNVPCRRIDMWSDRWRRAGISSAPDSEARLCRVLGDEISTSVHFPTQPPEAYSQSLHKPSCEEMMVQGDEAGYEAEQSADVQGARGWSTAYPALGQTMSPLRMLCTSTIAMEFLINSSRILWRCLLSQRGGRWRNVGQRNRIARNARNCKCICSSPLVIVISPQIHISRFQERKNGMQLELTPNVSFPLSPR